MNTKPIITWHGDQAVFNSLEPLVTAGLPRDSVEWRRSYGRAARTIHVEAEFVPFNADKLLRDNRAMVGHPFFHIYWTDCDLDAYKASFKDDITTWLTALKKHNITDWMIVIVVNDENKVKTKILRTSVIDKVRSDFCSKTPDRCIVLAEPLRTDSKSSESWATVLIRLRQLLLQAYNKSLSKFEDGMRAERERRTQTGWSFCQYFLLQEELAFVFDMLGLYDDALVQYDELDALFTQFILNHAAGDTAEWLSNFNQPCTRWAGLSLSTTMDVSRRSMIQQNKATLLDLRDYLFSRQCALLLLMNRPWEVAQRAISFMNNCIQELKILEVPMPQGSVACWSFVSCLEVMHTCERYSSGQVETYSMFTASLWEYAHKKLHELGILCGLMPGTETSSHQLQIVVDLLTGMEQSKSDSEAMAKLREALSSKNTFEKHYLEIAELAMGTFKYIGRIRSARVIGQSMAKFYMLLGKPGNAEPFLVDAVKTYHQERWSVLADHTWLELANCQSKLENTQRYLKSCTFIAASQSLPPDQKQHYCDEMLRIASQNTGTPLHMKLEPAFALSSLTLATKGPFILGQDITVDLHLDCILPSSVTCENITLIVNTETATSKAKSRNRHSSSSSITSIDSSESQDAQTDITRIDFQLRTDVSPDKRLSSVSFVCSNAHAVLRRTESGQGFMMDRNIKKEEASNCFRINDVTLANGMNRLSLVTKAQNEGSFTSGQLCVSLKGIEFIKTQLPNSVHFDVTVVEPKIELKFNNTKDYLVAGIKQEIEVVLYTQSYDIPGGSVLSLSSPPGLDITWADSGTSEIQLECGEPYQTLRLLAKVFAQVTELEQQFVDYEVTMMCSWCSCSFQPIITVQQPFQVKHNLHTAGLRKFVQVIVKGVSNANFELTQPLLETSKSPDVDAVSLNKKDQTLFVSPDQTALYMWQLVNNTPETPELTCWFSVQYQEAGTDESRECASSFTLTQYNTLYDVRCCVVPKSGESCRIGDLCLLEVEIDSLDINCVHDQLAYEVILDSNNWAIASSEKRSGIVSLNNGTGQIAINMLPLVTGYLRLPGINVFKYSAEKTSEIMPPDAPNSVTYEQFCDGQIYNSTRGRNVEVVQAELSVTV